MNQPRPTSNGGFSYIEVIAALAFTALVVVEIAPRILEAISDSKINQAISAIKSLQNAVAKYSSDLGTLYPLSVAGVATPNGDSLPLTEIYQGSLPEALTLSKTAPPASSEAGLWRKFEGPYSAPLTRNSPLGTEMILCALPSIAGAPTTTNATFSLTASPNAGLAAGTQLVFVRFEGVEHREFEKLDSILDPGIGSAPGQKNVLGKVKWDPITDELMVYIAHR
jgi:type II secretory pathway pseudopilin PulG